MAKEVWGGFLQMLIFFKYFINKQKRHPEGCRLKNLFLPAVLTT
jgi:hypothetical protein